MILRPYVSNETIYWILECAARYGNQASTTPTHAPSWSRSFRPQLLPWLIVSTRSNGMEPSCHCTSEKGYCLFAGERFRTACITVKLSEQVGTVRENMRLSCIGLREGPVPTPS